MYSVIEPISGRLRPIRSQQEGARDKPYIHYLPPDRAPQLTHSGMHLSKFVLLSPLISYSRS